MTDKPLMCVQRFPPEPDWTLSEFYIDGIRRGVGVEDEPRVIKVKGETRIQNAIYEFDFAHSPKFSKHYFADDRGYLSATQDKRFTTPHLLITLLNVPNFDRVLWHWGNTDDDTDACYIVGSTFATFDKQKGVGGSRVKYLEIYPVIYQQFMARKAKGLKSYVEYKDKTA